MEREANFWNITVPLKVVKLGTVVRHVRKSEGEAPEQFGHIVGFALLRRRKPFGATGYDTHEDVLAVRVQFAYNKPGDELEAFPFEQLELI